MKVAGLVGAVGLATLVPVLLLSDRAPPPHRAEPLTSVPIVPSAAGSLDAALARGLLAPAAPVATAGDDAARVPDDAPPQVAGIVGRLPDRAVALVRRQAAGMRTMGVGEEVGGWRLVSIAADAVLFVRGDRRERVEVATAPDGDQ